MEALSLPPKDPFSTTPDLKLSFSTDETEEDPHPTPPRKAAAGKSKANTGSVRVLSKKMAPAAAVKTQAQCLESCNKTSKLGDRIAVHLFEHLAESASHIPKNIEELAHGFLDTCQIVFAIQAGLKEATSSDRVFPADVLSELDRKFRVLHGEFQLLDQMVKKLTEYATKGTLGRMKRSWGKMTGDKDIDKMTFALARTRETLRLSALMFKWTLGSDKVDSSAGIGFTGLAAALDRLDHSQGRVLDRSVNGGHSPAPQPAPSSSQANLAPQGTRLRVEEPQPPLPPLPWSERTSSRSHENVAPVAHLPESRSNLGHTSIGATSSIRSSDRVFDRFGSFDDGMSVSAITEPDDLLEDIAGMDFGASRLARLKADPPSMPHWEPRSRMSTDLENGRNSLVSAIRSKNAKVVEQLLDRGVSPNAGPDLHALKEALCIQDIEIVRILLAFGADPNAPDSMGASPLHTAVDKTCVDGAAMLLKYGADPNSTLAAACGLDSPLVTSVRAHKIKLTHLLLVYGGDVQQLSGDGDTLLIISIGKKTSRKLLDLILDYGADPNVKSAEGKTALFEAIQAGRADLVTSLLDHGAEPNLPGPKHMLWPATYQPPCLQVLLSRGADPKKAPGVMELASSLNRIESVRILLDAGVDPNAKKDGVYTPLCTAIRDNRKEIFQLLLSRGADPNTKASEYPLWKCITHKRVHFMPALLAAGASLTSPKGILEQAVSSNNMEALVWLLDQQVDPNMRNADGSSPLTTAIRENRAEMVDLLISRGADPNLRGQDWPICMAVRSPAILRRILAVISEPRAFKGVMEMAVTAGQLESVKLLVAAGVSIEDRNGGVFSPLTTAIRTDNKQIVSYLMNEGGADVNAPGEHLPIVKALRRYKGDTDIITWLLEKGADPNKVYRGWNAMMQAVEMGDAKVLKLLTAQQGVDLGVVDDLGRTVPEMAASRGWQEGVAIIMNGRSGP